MKYIVAALSTLLASSMAAAHPPSGPYCPPPKVTVTVTAYSGPAFTPSSPAPPAEPSPMPAHPTSSALPSPSPSPSPSPTAIVNEYFTVTSARSASPIHLLALTARKGKFYLGGATSANCPADIGNNCPPVTNSTVFAGGNQTLSLAVTVPGGQQVYVAPNGALSYTTPHSGYIIEGSDAVHFNRTAPGENNLGTLTYKGGWVACQSGDNEGWQVFGKIDGVQFAEDCLSFSALTAATQTVGAWRY